MRALSGYRRWPAALVAVMAIASAQGEPHSLGALVDTVMRRGPSSQLPAHLSLVLGISRAEQATQVKQAVVRDGVLVRTINVCVAKQDDVVLIAYNETTHASKAYLVSPAGALRKAVAYQAGAPSIERPLKESRADAEREIKFWTDFGKQPGTR